MAKSLSKRKKRLNKKLITILLLIGTPVFLLGLVVVDSRRPFLPGFIHSLLGRDPVKLFERGKELLAELEEIEAANEAEVAQLEDPEEAYNRLQELREGELKEKSDEVRQVLGSAVKYAQRQHALRKDIYKYLMNFYWDRNELEKSLGYGQTLLKMDLTQEERYEAKRKVAEYYYGRAQYGGGSSFWTLVLEQVDSEDPPGLIQLKPDDVYGYILKAHALLLLEGAETVEARATVDETIAKALELDDANIRVRHLLAMLAITDAQKSEDGSEEQERLRALAEEHLRLAMEKNPDDLEVYLNYYELWLLGNARKKAAEKYDLADAAEDEAQKEKLIAEGDTYFVEIEAPLDEWIERFPDKGLLYVTKAKLKQLHLRDITELDPIIELYEKSLKCDDAEVGWYVSLASKYHLRSEYAESPDEDLLTAFKLLRRALYMPGATEIDEGVKQALTAYTRFRMIIPLTVDICAVLSERTEDQQKKTQYLEIANKFSRELCEKVGADDRWAKAVLGTIALAEDRKDEGIKYLYEADQQFGIDATTEVTVRQVKWKLFEALRDTQYRTLAVRYASEVFMMRMPRPARDYVEYMKIISELPGRSSQESALEFVRRYEKRYGSEVAYRQIVLTTKARLLLRLGQKQEAKEVLAELQGDTDELNLLRVRALDNVDEQVQRLTEMIQKSPDNTKLADALYSYCIAKGKEDATYYVRGREGLEPAVKSLPDDLDLKMRQKVLSEPDPGSISTERMREIMLELCSSIKDPLKRAMEFGKYYEVLALSEQDEEKFRQNWVKAKEYYSEAAGIKPDDVGVLAAKFMALVNLKDWPEAERVVGKMGELIAVDGLFYDAHLQSAQGEWSKAIGRLENFLAQRPISIEGHLLLASAYWQLKRADEAIVQAQTAVAQDYNSGAANKLLVRMSHSKNVEIGLRQLSREQSGNAFLIVRRAMKVVPDDAWIKSLFVVYNSLEMGYLSDQIRQPGLAKEVKNSYQENLDSMHQSAVQICELLVKQEPQNVDYWIMRAKVFMEYSEQVDDTNRKSQLLKQAEQVYLEAMKQNPKSAALADDYGVFLRKTGRGGEGEKLLQDMIANSTGPDKHEAMMSLSDLYRRQHKYNQAGLLLVEILKENPDHRTAGVMVMNLYVEMERYEDAIDIAKQLRRDEDSEYLMGQHIEILLKAGRDDEAELLLEQMRKSYPDSMNTPFLAANLAMRKTNYVEAVAYTDQIIAKDPKKSYAYLLKGMALFYQDTEEHLQKAMETLKQLRNIEPSGSVLGRDVLAEVYWRLGYYDDAISELKAVLSQYPDDMKLRNRLISKLKRRGRWSELDKFYSDMIESDPKNASLYIEASRPVLQQAGEYAQKKQHSQAVSQYNRVLEMLKKGMEISRETGQKQQEAVQEMSSDLLVMGNYYMTQAQEDRAKGQTASAQRNIAKVQEYFSTVITLADQNLQEGQIDARLRLDKAEATFLLGQEQEALNQFEKLLEMVADNPDLSDMVVTNVKRVGRPANLVSWCKQKLIEKPDWTVLHLVLAGIYEENGRFDQAIPELLAGRSAVGGRIQIIIDRRVARAYMIMSNWDKAIEVYRRLVEQIPGDADQNNNLAYALMQLGGHDEEAVEVAKKAYAQNRTNTDVMDTYAMALMRIKDYKNAELMSLKAIQELQRTDNSVPPEYEYHLAEALQGQGHITEAQERLRRTLKRLSDSPEPGSASWQNKINELLKEME